MVWHPVRPASAPAPAHHGGDQSRLIGKGEIVGDLGVTDRQQRLVQACLNFGQGRVSAAVVDLLGVIGEIEGSGSA